MITLTLSMLRSRWAQALTVLVLAVLAMAAAVAAPLYVEMAERAVIADDVATAPASQRTITAVDVMQVKADPGNEAEEQLVESAHLRDFENVAVPAVATPGFATVYAVAFPTFTTAALAQVGGGTADRNGSLEFRQAVCEHVTIVVGRCLSAPGEVIVSAARAQVGLSTGTTALVTSLRFRPGTPGEPGVWLPDGEACRLAVVGVYQPTDPADLYWGGSGQLLRVPGREPVFADRRSVASCDHRQESAEAIAYPLPATFAADNLEAVREAVRSTLDRADAMLGVTSRIDVLLASIDVDRAAVAAVPIGAAVPLVALCWFVLFLAVAHTSGSRRRELGVVKLRGVSTADQWWLAAAESLAPVLAGSPAGVVASQAGVWAYGQWTFGPSATVALDGRAWAYGLVTLAGTVVAALVALRRDLVSSATDLLRRVPAHGGAWAGLTLAGLLGAAATVAVIQLHAQSAAVPTGLARLAPALSLMALGILCATAVEPIAARIGGWALRRGSVGLAVGALQLGRTRNGSRLLALAVVAMALLSFAAAAAEVSASARRSQVERVIGAERVLSVSQVSAPALLHTVRAVDPQGAYAMAVMTVDNGPDVRRPLALDTTRLATAALWPGGGLSTQAATAALRPVVAAPVIVRGDALAVTATTDVLVVRTPRASMHLQVTVAPLDGSPALTYELGELRTGRHVYTTPVRCTAGCRLSALAVSPRGVVAGEVRLTLESVRQSGPDAVLVTPAGLGQWRNRDAEVLRAEATAAGMRISAASGLLNPLRLTPPDTPAALPMLDAGGTTVLTLELANRERITSTMVAVTRLPRLGTAGVVVDLEYLLRYGEISVASRSGEIWLGPAAPADAAARFRAAGLVVTAERRLSDEMAAAARRPSSAGVRFFVVVAVLGLALGVSGLAVAAGVERRGRAEELRSLRTQGFSRRQARRAALVGHVGVVAVAIVLGGLCAVVSWQLTGAKLPLVDGPGAAALVAEHGPGQGALAAWVAGAAVLVLLALILSVALTRAAENRLADSQSAGRPAAGHPPAGRPPAGQHARADRSTERKGELR